MAANPLLALAAAQQQANPVLMAHAHAAYQQQAVERLRQSASAAAAARFSPYRVRPSPPRPSDSSSGGGGGNSVSSAFKSILPKASPPPPVNPIPGKERFPGKVSVTPPAAAPATSPDSQIKSMEELVNGLNGGGSSSTFGISHEISI